jgi:hypothetical protein
MPERPVRMNLRYESHTRAGAIWKQILSGLYLKYPLYQTRAEIPCSSE